MSRVGKQPVKILSGVKVNVSGGNVRVEGPKGKLSHALPDEVSLKIEKDELRVERKSDGGSSAVQGVTRAVLHNMVHGVATGFTRELDVVGVGYRAAVKGSTLTLNVGYSHQVDYELPEGVAAKVDKNTHIILTGADKITLGMAAAKIRAIRPPEPYQGKGIKYTDETIIRKQGKAAGAK